MWIRLIEIFWIHVEMFIVIAMMRLIESVGGYLATIWSVIEEVYGTFFGDLVVAGKNGFGER